MEVRELRGTDELADALAIRQSVFVDEQGVPEHLECDGRDGAATHVIASDGDESVGTARLRTLGEGIARIERVAVVRSRRGEGIGRQITIELERIAERSGIDELVLHAQRPVVEFYRRLGYSTVGEPFEEAGIEHLEMRKQLQE